MRGFNYRRRGAAKYELMSVAIDNARMDEWKMKVLEIRVVWLGLRTLTQFLFRVFHADE